MEKLNNLTREEMIDLLMDNDFEDIRNERFLEDSWVSDILLQGFEGYGHMTDEELKDELLERELVLNSFTFNDIYDELSKDLKDDMSEVGFTDNGIKEIIEYFVDVQDDEALQELNAGELAMTMYYDVMAGNFDSWLSDINEKYFVKVDKLLGHDK